MDSGKLIATFYAKNIVAILDDNLEILCFFKTERPMGIAPLNNNRFYVVAKKGLFLLNYKNKEIIQEDFIPLIYNNYHDCHKLDNIILVNSKFGIIEQLDGSYYKPLINPNMTKDNHINCVAIENNQIKYLTAFSKDKHNKKIEYRGILYDCQKEQIILEGLNKPHSPKLYKNDLWFCNSGEGTLNKSHEVIYDLGSFTRGLAFEDQYVYVGISCLRRNKKSLSNSRCAVAKINIYTGTLEFEKQYNQGQQIYDLQLLK